MNNKVYTPAAKGGGGMSMCDTICEYIMNSVGAINEKYFNHFTFCYCNYCFSNFMCNAQYTGYKTCGPTKG